MNLLIDTYSGCKGRIEYRAGKHERYVMDEEEAIQVVLNRRFDLQEEGNLTESQRFGHVFKVTFGSEQKVTL